MKIAIILPDDRDERNEHSLPLPYFGTAPTALFQGLKQLSEHEFHLVCCTHQPMPMPRKLEGNIHYHCVSVGSWGWMKSGYAGCVRAVRRKLQEIQPDIVHGQGTERFAALSAVFSGYPNVVTIHGNMRSVARSLSAPFLSFHWLAARLEAFALKRTLGVFCNSQYTEDLVRPLAKHTWRVPNAVQPVFLNTPWTAGHPSVPQILNIGYISPFKHQQALLALARNLYQQGLNFELVFIGSVDDSPYSKAFKEQLSQAGAFARHAGRLSPAEILKAMDQASALVHIPTEEGFGLVVAEALARNLKFFGTRSGGVIDIASGVEGTELFAPTEMAQLEQSIARWIKAGSPKPTTANRTMIERYSPESVAAKHIDIYKEILNSVRH